MSGYETFATTADIGIRISGANDILLFQNALKGLNHLYFNRLITATDSPAPLVSYPFQFEGDSVENILVNFLSEIIFLLQNDCRITVSVDIEILTHTSIRARFLTMPIPPLMDPSIEIKSVTYHNLKITDVNGIKNAEVIFDI